MKRFISSTRWQIGLVVLAPLISGAARNQVQSAIRGSDKPDGISPDSAKQITAVIATMQDILDGIESAEKEEAGNYKCFMEWCHNEVSTATETLKNTKLMNEQDSVEVQELKAALEGLSHDLETTKKEIETAQNLIDQTTNIRDQDESNYEQELQLNTQSIDQVNRAIKIVGGVQSSGGFLQNGVKQKLQLNQPGESSYVLGVMNGIKDKLDKNRQKMQESEQADVQKTEALLDTKTEQTKQLQKDQIKYGTGKTEKGVRLASVQNSVRETLKEIQETQDLLKSTMNRCDEKKSWWHRRGKDRLQEKAALKQAINYVKVSLQSGQGLLQGSSGKPELSSHSASTPAASFIQLSSSAAAAVQVGAASVQSQFQVLSAVLNGAAVSGDKGMLDGAKKVVTDLITVLEEEKKAETEKQKYCKGAIDAKALEINELNGKIEMLGASIQSTDAQITVLTNKIPQVKEAADALYAQLDKAKDIRKKEAADYKTQKADRILAVKVLNQAKVVLQQFYASKDNTAAASLAQGGSVSGADPPQLSTGSSRKDLMSFNVVQLVEGIIEDIEKEEKDAEDEETGSVAAFEKLAETTQRDYDDYMTEMGNMMKQKAKLLVTRGTEAEDKSSKESSLTATNDQKDSLHTECDDLLEHFDQRLKARAFEIAQLKDVLEILSGSSVAARTGLLEKGMLQQMSLTVSAMANKA